jgi:hypothetical protein
MITFSLMIFTVLRVADSRDRIGVSSLRNLRRLTSNRRHKESQ